MGAAIAKFEKTQSGHGINPANSKRTVQYVRREPKKTRFLRAAKKAFTYSLFISLAVCVAAVAGFFYFYNQYAEIVERRVTSGFWHTRAGVYAAPYVLRKDQKTNPETVVDLLRRSGYVEGGAADEIWNGSYQVNGDAIEIRTKNYASGEIQTALVRFKNNRIAAITDSQTELEEFNIEPELLSGRTETKRGKNHVLTYEDIPENLRSAIIAAEDRRFFEHRGIDPRGVIRALFENYKKGAVRQGGSTITQQLVKNTFLSPERSFSRKFSEAFLSLALERRMSKEEIFALYCNEIYLGQYGLTGIHGVEQAARAYFDKELLDLNLQEAAAIAAMIKNPTRFAPHKDSEEANTRRDWVVAKMAELGMAPEQEAEIARRSELKLAKPKANNQSVAPYFVDAATKEINEKFTTDYLNTNFNNRIYTTIDTQLQNLAEQALARQISALDKIYAKKGRKMQASIVAIDPRSGHVLAMVGGRDYKESQFNRATEAFRQPGSTFKPFVYAAALERGMTPATVANDSPTEFRFHNLKNYKPANYGDSYAMKNISLKTALAKSSNIVAVKTAIEVGLPNVARRAQAFGLKNVQPFPSMALGTDEVTPLQLAAAYCVFANGGRRVEPTFVERIISVEDETLYLSTPANEQVISPRTAFMLTDMLEAVVERGTARAAFGALGKDVVFAGKTGSSKDGWFVGYTPNLVTVAWIGLDESEDIGATGGEVALPLWIDFMKSVMQTRPEFGGENFAMPNGLAEVLIDPETGMTADSYCPQSEKVVVPTGMVSGIKCLKHQPLPETYTASVSDRDYTPSPASEVAAVVFERTVEAENAEEFKDINGIPTEKVQKAEPQTASPKVNQTYIEDFDSHQTKNLKEKSW